jgi:GNAT superfamily N-acetyltransferase
MELTIRPLTPDLWPALEDLFGDNGACNGCWCMYWRIASAYRQRAREQNKAAFREVVERGPPPGLLAFDGAVAVGWCQLTPRDALPWLERTWRLQRVDGVPVWSLSCLYVRKGCRRRGVTSALIAAALQAAKRAGARSLSVRCGRVPERIGHGLRLDVRTRRFSDRRPPHAGAPDHAPRSRGDCLSLTLCPRPRAGRSRRPQRGKEALRRLRGPRNERA